MGENDNGNALDKKKSHRERHSGRKAEKKKSKKDAENKNLEIPDKQRNPKAFAFNSAVRAERRFRRKQDIETKKQHIPVIDRTPIEPPPILVAVVGPPKVGKSTVINNLIRLFTKSPLTDIKGPVTIVTGKKRRITLIECNNDINSMIDIAKVADLVLLLCDASFGFEMEIFEFLNICQVHGMPRIMGVLTHLDMIKNSKTLKNTKKVLKHRFWTEVYPGAKLFYLSGIVHGEYLRNEIKNLGRFISIIKFRPLTWRSTHSYLLGDRYEDLTNQELIRRNPKCDRNISLYGYVRGVPLVKNTSVYIAGLGDLKIHDITYLPDPCPLPEVLKKRSLIEKEKFIYAPFSGVGGIVYDKDAVYVELGGSHSHKANADDVDDESKNMVANLIDTKETLDVKMQHSEMQIFTGGRKLTAKDIKEKHVKSSNNTSTQNLPKTTVDSDLDEELDELRNQKDYSNLQEETIVDESGRQRRKVIFDQNDKDFAEVLSNDDNESDSEDSDSSDEGFEQKNLDYTTLKQNKDQAIHDKVSKALKILDKKKSKTPTSDFELDENSDDESEQDENSDDEMSEEFSENSEEESDIPDDISLDSNESLVGLSKMKKRKEKIVDISEIPQKNNSKPSVSVNKNNDSKHTYFNSDNSSESESSENEIGISETKFNDKNKISANKEENEENSEDSNDEIENEQSEDSEEDIENKNDSEDNENRIKNKEDSDDTDEEDMAVKWKENLSKKARDAFLDRQRTTQNIMKLVYGVFDKHTFKLNEEESDQEGKNENEQDDIGGLFKLVTSEQKRKNEEKEKMNMRETSLFNTWDQDTKDWLNPENKILIENCFVTGQWKQSEDASELLKLDDMKDFSDDDSEIFGDFEDLETGEKHTAESKSDDKSDKTEKRKRTDSDSESKPLDREALVEKKRKLKEKFDSEYDNTENSSYYDDLKTSAEKQAQINKEVFENMPDDLRVQIEGFRPGMYVRIEFQDVPAEFITNFDPTYPLLIGALNIGEENIGYVNIKIKKHRWYKRILKTNDPLIISLGWRRFQTIPLFSKLEDDLKYRYLKYTPEHVQCNAHFWGPITPQGTGFLALQNVDGKLENVKQQGFRIAATGSVAELDKSTQIMKKLKLIGHPLKIYKKTAFIKDMFNSTLEVAKFEGARVKTVSGIRGQIKKAVSKPEGCFRATFEDKIVLSDIVFCRTWYKVDVPKFYCPVTTLLLPHDKKNSWQGVRTTGQLKREKGIKNEPNYDSLYTPIEREPKVFKPLVVPRKLQRQLPYRDKPKFAPLKSERKPNPEKKRVAVIREPHEKKVAEMLKMLRASYEHKQTQLKAQMSERITKHKAEIEAIESRKKLKERKQKKEIFRAKSKAKIREEKRGGK